jgi:hypothetical protein
VRDDLQTGGVFAVAASVLYASLGVAYLVDPRTSTWHDVDYVAYSLFAGASLMALATLVVLGHAQRHVLGRVGGAGFLVACVGLAGLIVAALDRVQAGEERADAVLILGFVLSEVGYLVVGWTTWRTRTLPIWAAFLPAIGVVGAVALQDAHGAGVWMALVWMALGITLIRTYAARGESPA